jgi:hypothetical protein
LTTIENRKHNGPQDFDLLRLIVYKATVNTLGLMKTFCLIIIAFALGVLLATPAQAHGVSPTIKVMAASTSQQTIVSAGQIEEKTSQDCDQNNNGTAQGSCCGDMAACCVVGTMTPATIGVTEHLSYRLKSPIALADQIGPSAIPDPQFKPPRALA